MGHVKPERFFQMYSGEIIDEIRDWITAELHLPIVEVEWITCHMSQGLPVRLEAKIITVRGEEHQKELASKGPITYRGGGTDEQ